MTLSPWWPNLEVTLRSYMIPRGWRIFAGYFRPDLSIPYLSQWIDMDRFILVIIYYYYYLLLLPHPPQFVTLISEYQKIIQRMGNFTNLFWSCFLTVTVWPVILNSLFAQCFACQSRGQSGILLYCNNLAGCMSCQMWDWCSWVYIILLCLGPRS